MSGWDEIVSEALAETTSAIARKSTDANIGERAHLEPTLSAVLAARYGTRITTGRKVPDLPDWKPKPGGVDILINHGLGSTPSGSPQVGIELKSYKLDETLWDILKMASLGRMAGVEATYIVVAATVSRFESQSDGAALFQTPLGEDTDWDASLFFTRWAKAWGDLLVGGTGRPTCVPDTITLRLVGAHDVPTFPGWQVRGVRVEGAANHGWLTLNGQGWL